MEGVKIYLDFLTERQGGNSGSSQVDDIIASVIPGIDRALASRQEIKVSGKDLYGAKKNIAVQVAGIGPLITLKVNAFGGPTGRRHPKDAFDLLLLVTSYIGVASDAIRGFHEEADMSNPAYESAMGCLKRDFFAVTADGPLRAAEFLRGTVDDAERICQDMVTVARGLLGEHS